MKIKNAPGKVFYGLHFYPGVAEYRAMDGDPYRVFINEDTIRQMSPTFAGCPVFVEHVDEVEQDREQLKNEADGWVIDSFFNPSDGKTWVKFIVVTERAERAIRGGMRLSNAYVPKSFGPGGLWNGVTYEKEILSGEFEHLAIVRNPRYDESVIMNAEQFKQYCEEREIEIKRLANSKQEEKGMLKFFKKAKLENGADLEGTSVVLPKSGVEKTVLELVNDVDSSLMMAKEKKMAGMSDMVKIGENEMSVEDLVNKYSAMCAAQEKPAEEKPVVPNEEEKGDKDKADIKSFDNKDEDAEKKKKEEEEKKSNELAEIKAKEEAAKKKENVEKLKNAHLNAKQETLKVDLMPDQVARGKKRYGSGN